MFNNKLFLLAKHRVIVVIVNKEFINIGAVISLEYVTPDYRSIPLP